MLGIIRRRLVLTSMNLADNFSPRWSACAPAGLATNQRTLMDLPMGEHEALFM